MEYKMKANIRHMVALALYPCLLALVILSIYLSIRFQWDYKWTYWMMTLFLLAVLIACERLFPLSDAWSMTGKSFFRDFRYILLNAPTIGATKALFGVMTIRYSETHAGLFTHAPVVASTAAFLLVFEFFQYWFHRLSHAGKGPVGGFLWRVHVAHHLPDKVYVMMHAVFNPINALISTAIIQIPLILLGLPPAAVLAATLLIDLQSLVSHFNADLRAGFLNYVFIGAETHRYHHSADLEEAKNFGNTLAIWDLVFGTYYYRPGRNPVKLGVADAGEYPASEKILAVLVLPFTGKGATKAWDYAKGA
jgi:sterol desaturase/sphingolipid hydroxylase (fatty acid hydroxylase superfamily)